MIRCKLIGHEWVLVDWRPTSSGAASWVWVNECLRCRAQHRTSATPPQMVGFQS